MKVWTINSLQGRWRLLAIAAVMAVAVLSGTAQATVPPSATPVRGSAQVDGSIGDWDTGIAQPPANINTAWPNASQWANSVNAASYFADMYRAGRPDLGKPVESRIWTRYDCSTSTSGTLYVLVLAAPGVYIQSSGDQFIKRGINRMLVDSGYGADGNPPDFAWVNRSGALARGWEASIQISSSFTLPDEGFNVHAQVIDGGSQTSAVANRGIPLTIPSGSCPAKPAITTSTSYTRTFDWSITKTADPASVNTPNATTSVNYNLDIVKSDPIDGDFTVTGTVANVSGAFTVQAVPSGGAPVTCPVTSGSYTCTIGSKADGVIIVTYGGGTTATKPYAFGASPSSTTRNAVTVEDNKGGGSYIAIGGTYTSSISIPYGQTITMPDPGAPCVDRVNTARVKDGATILDTASATVRLCRLVAPSATVVPTFDRTYTWSIEKSASPASTTTLLASVDVAYSVVATRSAAIDSNKVVTGAVTGAVATAISATANAGGTPVCAVTDTGTSYSCTMANATASGTITITYAGGTIVKPYAFTDPTSVTKETATVQDDKTVPGAWQNLATGSTGGTSTYTTTLDTPLTGCTTWTNIARVMADGVEQARDSADVEICRGVTPQLTANPSYARTYNWSLVKTADPASMTTSMGSYTVDYAIDVVRSAPVDYGFTVTGVVGGITAPFTATAGPTGTEVTCTTDQTAFTYSCALPAKADGTVTVTPAGGAPLTQDYGLSSLSPSVTTRETGTLQDDKTDTGNYVDLKPVTGSTTASYPLALTVPASDCTTYVNTARVVSDGVTVATDDASTRLCRTSTPPPPSGAAPSFFGTANPTFTRTNTWSVVKKVLNGSGQWVDLAQIETDSDRATATYQVTISKTGEDSNPSVAGSLQITNPGGAAINVTLAFTTSGCTAPAGLTFSVPAAQSVTRAYTCSLAAVADGAVGVTMTWTGGATGTATYSLPYAFGQPTTVIKPYVTAMDTQAGASEPVRIAETYEPITLTYTGTQPALTACPTWSSSYTNTVRIYEGSATSGSALASDTADLQTCTNGDLDPRDTWLAASADPTFKASYYWDIEKQFDGAQLSPDGRYADLAYTINMRRSPDMFGSEFVIRGEAAFTSLNANPLDRILAVAVPGIAGATCQFDDSSSRYIEVPSALSALDSFSPEYTCVLPRKIDAQVVVGLYEGSKTGASTYVLTSTRALDSVRTSYFFAAPTSYERRTIDVWDTFDGAAPARKALVSSMFRSVSYVDRVQLTDLSNCSLYVNRASIFEAGKNPTLASPLDTDVQDVYFCPWTDLQPLEMQINLAASYLRSYDWTLSKTVGTPTLNSTDGTVTIPYAVEAARLDPVDGDYSVDGSVTLYNPNPFVLSGMVLRNSFAPLISCNITEVTLNFQPFQTQRVPFTCTVGARTNGTLTSTVRGSGIGQTVDIEDFAFGDTSTREVNGAATVFDRFSTDAEAPLAGGSGITSGSTFQYSRVVPLKRGCVVYPNTARLGTADGLAKFSRTTAQICYQANGDVTYIDSNSNTIFIGSYKKSSTSVTAQAANGLRVTKIGPSRAKPGQTVTYRIRVTNTGFEAISGITLTDVLPSGMRFRGVLPSNGVQLRTKGKWTFSLRGGASKTIVLKVDLAANATGKKCNVATATFPGSTATSRDITCLKVAGAPKQPNVTG